MYIGFLLLSLCNAYSFPPPTSKTNGWHPIHFLNNYKDKPQRIQFTDANYVLWKGKILFI